MPAPGPDEALRRRLYEPGATPEDVDRYRSVAVAPPGPPVADPAEPVPSRSRRRILPSLLVLLAVVAVLGSGAALLRSVPGPGPTSVGAPTSPPGPEPVPVSAAARVALAEGVSRGDATPISALFRQHPESIPASLTGDTRADTEEYAGSGPRVVDLDPSALAMHGGRLTVVLVLGDRARASWRALRLATTPLHAAAWRVVARGTDVQDVGLPTSATVRYAAPAPTRMAIAVPRGVRWAAAVVFTD